MNLLERQLQRATSRVEELTANLESKQSEIDSKVQEMQKQQTTQTDLEHKLQEAKQEIEALVQHKSASMGDLQRELQEAKKAVKNITEEKDSAMASLEAIAVEVKELRTKVESQKATQLEAQLHVAKLQTELRDCKKESDKLATDAAEAKNCLLATEETLKQKQKELDENKFTMETYEEKFVERESELEAIQEEKDFAGRELDFARSEIQLLKESLSKNEQEFAEKTTAAGNEQLRLQETLKMAQKELGEQKQFSYDREHELQTQLNLRTSELNALRQQSIEAATRESSLEAALQQRDADLVTLNEEVDTNLSAIKDQLAEKAKTLKDNLALLEKTENERDSLLNQLQQKGIECKAFEMTQAELIATIAQRDAALANKANEINNIRDAAKVVQQEKSCLEKETGELKDVASGIYQEKCRITEELQETKAELSDAKAQATKTQDDLLLRAKQLESKERETQCDLKNKEQELATVTGQLERAAAKAEALSNDVENQKSELQAASATIKSLHDERDEMTGRVTQLKADVSDKEHEIKSLGDAFGDAKANQIEFANQIVSLEKQLSEFESARTVLEQESETMKREIEALNTQIDSQRERLDSNAVELFSKSSEVLALQTTVENLREDLAQQREEIESSEKGLIAAQAQYTQLHERFMGAAGESSEKLQSLTDELIAAQDEIANNSTTRSKLERQILSLTQQVQDRDEQMLEINSQLKIATEMVDELRSANVMEKAQADSKIAELFEDVTKESANVHNLAEECETQARENTNLKQELASLVKRLASSSCTYKTEKDTFEKERTDLVNTVSSQQEELASLTQKHSVAVLELTKLQKQLKDTEITCEDQLMIMGNDVKAKEKKIGELSSEKDANITAISSCREELSAAKIEMQQLKESKNRSSEELAHLNSLLESQRSDHMAQLDELVKRQRDESARFAKEKLCMESSIRKAEELRTKLKTQIERTENLLEQEREKNECLAVEQDALEMSLHRAEDLAADLQCELNILKEGQANESFDNSVDSGTLVLSKNELRSKCKMLAEEIQEAEVRAATGASTVSQKQTQMRRMEADMKEMSGELTRMIGTSEQLESALLKARLDKATTEADAEALRTSIDAHQAKTKALKEELDQQYSENSELLDQVRGLQQQQKNFNERETDLQQELQDAKQACELLHQENAVNENKVVNLSQKLAEMTQKRTEVESKQSDLEFQIAQITDDLAVCEKEKALVSSDLQRNHERFEEQVREWRNESSEFKTTIANLESQVETHLSTIRHMEDVEHTLQEKLVKERAYGVKMGGLREDAVLKLAEASRVLAAQKGIINVHESKASQADENAKKLSNEVESLQETIKTMESEMEDNGIDRLSRIEEMEKKRALLEKAKFNAKAEADLLRDEVRQANRKATELDRINKSLQTKIEELKTTAETTKAQLREVKGAWTESDGLSRRLESDLQGSRAEIDHLRAKLQLCGATIARLKSDRVLLEEAAMQTETNIGSADTSAATHRELSRLKSELHTKASQLSSSCTTLRNYQRVCTEMKTTEKELVIFIEDIISRADETFNALMQISSEFSDAKVMDDAYKNCCLNFASIVQQSSAELEGKKKRLLSWRDQHSSTPTKSARSNAPGTLLSPTESSVRRVFGRMKEFIGNQDQHPQIETAIISLEEQIDGLVGELRSANSALRAKDKLFADLELERSSLQKKTAPASAPQGNRNLSAIQEVTEGEKEKMQTAAVRQVAKVFEIRSKNDAASALRKWSNVTAAQHAEDQKHAAHQALSNQLENTRSKLIQLKSQFKKGGRNSGASSDIN